MDQVDEVKEKLDIVEYINAKVPLKRSGRNYKANCPFHQEKTPSFYVNADRQIWRCFGACDEGGDIISFLRKYENLEFPEALQSLADEAGIKLKRRNFGSEQSQKKQQIYELNHLSSEYYHYLLTTHKVGESAKKYLKDRGIGDKSIKLFNLGYAPGAWDSLYKYLIGKKYAPQLVEEAGLIIKSSRGRSFYDRFRARIIFPIQDHRHNIVGFSGRLLENNPKQAKYINTPETPVYHKRKTLYGLANAWRSIQDKKRAIIVEGEFDVISSFQAGISNIVAVKGSGLSEDQLKLLSRYTEKIIFALDADMAGENAIRRGVIMADEHGFDIGVIPLKKGKDPDELIRTDLKSWLQAVKRPKVYFDYMIDITISRLGLNSSHSKEKIIKNLSAFFAQSNNPIVRAHYIKRLANEIDLPEGIVYDAIEKEEKKLNTGIRYRSVSKNNILTEAPKPDSLSRLKRLEEYILSIILQSNNPVDLIKILEKHISISNIPKDAVTKILLELKNYKPGKKFSAGEFIRFLDKELIPVADKAYMADIDKKDRDELNKTLGELKKLILREELKKLSLRLKKFEKTANHETKIDDLNKQILDLTKKIKK